MSSSLRHPLIVLLASACVHPVKSGWSEEDLAFELELDLRTVTTVPRATPELEEVLAPVLGEHQERWGMRLLTRQSRSFRDGSEGVLLAFDEVWAAPVVAGQEAERQVSPLQGRSLELRRFGDGEVLDVDLVQWVAGGAREAEVFDLIVPLLSPQPPDLEVQQTVARSSRWPFRVDKLAGQRGLLEADWTYLDLVREDGQALHHLRYEGVWSTLGADRRGPLIQAMRGDGTAQGEVWLSKADLTLVRHDFQWQRQVELRGPPPGEDAPLRQVFQEQTFEGRLERRP